MYSLSQIKKQLESFESAKGKPVTMHTSLKAIGKTEGGAEELLSLLIEHFTRNGGIFSVPTHTWDGDVFDRRTNKTCLGVLPTVAAGFPNGVRSLHPTHSVVVFGKGAEDFVRGEEMADTPANPNGFYGKLWENDGYILLAGVGQEKNTFIHCVEEMMNVPDRLTTYKVEKTIIHSDGREEKRHLYWFDDIIPDVSVYFGKFESAFRYYGCIEDGFIGDAPVQLCSARKIKETLEIIYKRSGGKELLADDKPLCEELYK